MRQGRRRSDSTEPAERLRVLLIDSHEDTTYLFSVLLEQAGYQVSTAADGGDGWIMATQLLPDLIVTELRMPTIDAFGLLERLRQNPLTTSIPVLVVTATSQPETLQRARDAGAAETMFKSSELGDVLDAVHRVASRSGPRAVVERRLRRKLLALRRVARAAGSNDEEVRVRVGALIDRLQVAVLLFDDEGRSVVAVNEAVSLMTGYSRDELLAMSLFALAAGPPDDQMKEWLAPEPFEGEYRVLHKNGSSVDVHAVGLGRVTSGLHAAAFHPRAAALAS